MRLNLTYDTSWANAPAGAQDCVNAVKAFFESRLTNDIDVQMTLSWDEIAGIPMGAPAESLAQFVGPFTAAQVSAPLGTTVTLAGWPSGSEIVMTKANAKALGLVPNDLTLDGYVGFSAKPFGAEQWNLDPTMTTLQYNDPFLAQCCYHEFSENLGRLLGIGRVNSSVLAANSDLGVNDGKPQIFPLDFFNYASGGTLAYTSWAGWFSHDGANMDAMFNSNEAGDPGDWDVTFCENSAVYDTNASGLWYGLVPSWGVVDNRVMHKIGYTLL